MRIDEGLYGIPNPGATDLSARFLKITCADAVLPQLRRGFETIVVGNRRSELRVRSRALSLDKRLYVRRAAGRSVRQLRWTGPSGRRLYGLRRCTSGGNDTKLLLRPTQDALLSFRVEPFERANNSTDSFKIIKDRFGNIYLAKSD